MCDSLVLQEIETVVNNKCQKGELFTAFDVTKAVRAKVGRSTPVPHNDVKQEVHNLFANGQLGSGYTRTLGSFPLPTGVPQPWIYHLSTDDVSVYGQGIPQLSGSALTPTQVQNVLNSTPDPDDVDDGVNKNTDGYYSVDGRETLCVPKALLETAGFHPGDEAYVSADVLLGKIVISKNLPDKSVLTELSSYTVDAYGNVRITQSTLVKGGCGGKKFEIDGDSSKVTVRKVS